MTGNVADRKNEELRLLMQNVRASLITDATVLETFTI